MEHMILFFRERLHVLIDNQLKEMVYCQFCGILPQIMYKFIYYLFGLLNHRNYYFPVLEEIEINDEVLFFFSQEILIPPKQLF